MLIENRTVSEFGAEGKDPPAAFFVFFSLLLFDLLSNDIMARMK